MIRSQHENRKPFAPNSLKIPTRQHRCNKADWSCDCRCPARGCSPWTKSFECWLQETSRPRSIASNWVPWIGEARCPPRVSWPSPLRGTKCWLRPMVISLLRVTHVSADQLKSVTQARTKFNTGGSSISKGRRNDVEERRTGAGSSKDSEL